MFKRILLPVDLTHKHSVALQTAADLARKGEGEVMLLHVVETIPGLPVAEEKDFYRRLEQTANEHLAALAAGLRALQVACRYEVVFGARPKEILQFATTQNCDLIVLTAPAFQPDHPAGGLGSLGWKVAVVAACPVLLVKSAK